MDCSRLSLLVVAGLFLGNLLEAQVAAPRRSPIEPPPEVLAEMEKGPHYGDPEESLVAVEVANLSVPSDTRVTRRASGIVLRCDGYILCPTSLFAVAEGEKASDITQITVITRPGTREERRIPARKPAYIPRDAAYCALKLDNIHLPAARISLPEELKPNRPLEMMSIEWNPTLQKYAAPITRRVAVAESAAAATAENGDISFRSDVGPPPLGAILLDSEGRAVGMCAMAGGRSAVSFEVLNRATNCVSPLPKSARHKPDDSGPPAPAGHTEMIKIPGGPVRIPRALQQAQPDLELAAVACVGEFEIDRFEVRNSQYLEFWKSIPERERKQRRIWESIYPLSWAEEEAPFPDEVAGLPVLGVSTAGAAAYARWKGKRLPTPCEWARAAFGPRGEEADRKWMREYIADRQVAWDQVKAAHARFLAANQPLFRQEMDPRGDPAPSRRRMPSVYHIPWIVSKAECATASAYSRQVLEEAIVALETRWTNVSAILEPGARPFDNSPFGVLDMALNARELVVPWPGGSSTKRETLYFSPAWQTPPLPAPDHWMPLWAPLARLGSMLPLNDKALASLLTRYQQPPTKGQESWETTIARLNATSAAKAVTPITGWMFRVGHGDSVPDGGIGYWRLSLDHPHFPAGGRVWAGKPRGFRREIGRDIPEVTPTRWVYRQMGPNFKFQYEGKPDLEFLLPIGFRCAR